MDDQPELRPPPLGSKFIYFSHEDQKEFYRPTGTVTFLFTDIEGSTQRWERRDAMDAAVRRHAWINTRQIWGVGTVNFATGKIHIDAYMQ